MNRLGTGLQCLSTSRPALLSCSRPPPSLGQSPSQLMLLKHLKGPSRQLLVAPSGWGTLGWGTAVGGHQGGGHREWGSPGWGTPGWGDTGAVIRLWIKTSRKHQAQNAMSEQQRWSCQTQARGCGPCCWRLLRPGLRLPNLRNQPPKGPRPFWPQVWAGRAPSPAGAPTAAGPGDTKPHLQTWPFPGTHCGRADTSSETSQGERLCPPTGKETLPEALRLDAHSGCWGHPLPFSRQRGP